MSRRIFETGLEKIGRIIASQYDINVVFEGTAAMTDGKTIYLPSTADLSDELMTDMHGFLDHEVSHCRYTDFDQVTRVISGRGGRFHKELLNSVEDGRIERLLVADFPGCAYNLDPLNAKLRGKLKAKWAKIPWPVRLVLTIRDLMDGEEDAAIDDAEIKPFLDRLAPEIAKLNDCRSTQDVRELTEIMTRKILDALDEQEKKDAESKGEESEGSEGKGKGKEGKGKGKGKGSEDEGSEGKGSEGKGSEGKGSEGKGSEGSGKGSEGKDGKGGGGEPRMGDSESGKPGSGKGDKMMSEGTGRASEVDSPKTSSWNEHDLSVDDMVRRDLKAHFGDETPTKRDVETTVETAARRREREIKAEELVTGGKADIDRSRSSVKHLPLSTRFDKEIDYTGEGNKDGYRRILAKVKPYIMPIKRLLERKLKVDAHTKTRGERERGAVDTRTLSRLATDKTYNRPFKELTRAPSQDVAVEILIDLSGSMCGPKIEVAKMSTVAMAEALKELQIEFEITGFSSIGDANLINLVSKTDRKSLSRFNRRAERLEKRVFKRFDSHDLSGIERVSTIAQNPDGECVRWAADRLATRKQKRKILIVMSDGEPATGEGDFTILRGDLHATIRKIMKSGIEVIGFGIQTTSVKEFYPDSLVINRLEELPVKTMTKLASLLTK